MPRLGRLLLDLLQQLADLGRSVRQHPDRHRMLKEGQLAIFSRSLLQHGFQGGPEAIANLLAIDLELNAQGMAVWLDRDKAD